MISIQQWQKWMNKGSASIPSVLLQNYKKLSISDHELLLIIHLQAFADEGTKLPSMELLLERMTSTEEELSQMLNRMHKNGVLDIAASLDDEGKHTERYCLNPLWEKLYLLLANENREQVAAASASAWPDSEADASTQLQKEKLEGEIFLRCEQEFGRPLSPIECETIGFWLDEDGYEPQMIFLALKEAVVSGKLSLRYIDRILFEWQKSGVRTLEQVREHSKKFRQQQISKSKGKTEKQEVEFTFYNWLK
ncbi:DnaD domain-containing protein [Bacillus horti]|uniref:DNA replication protein n=1 Tax=Caldalkalibacillus horti TaxID=77523 RepID=A0ABT9VX96_9BACI|nr:DnaD domain-containing protein [Bacillus horti]MDQ0165515.1 DNA replication protein [Bacillus horti]